MHTPKHILTFLSIFLFSNLAFSQVVIKDTVVITPKGGDKSSALSISNPQYYTATITVSCDALNNTHDPQLARGSVDAQIGSSTIHIADALQPADLGRFGALVYTSSPNAPLTLDMPIQLFIGGIQDSLTQDNPLFFEIIADSTLVGSVVYQETYPFPIVHVSYPLDGQNIFGAKTIHAEAQVDPSPDNTATVTWSVSSRLTGYEWSTTPADIDLTGLDYDDMYIKATATNKYGSEESGPVEVGIYSMNYLPGNNVYPRYSGTLTVQATPDLVDSSFYNPSNAMQLTMNGVTLLSSSVLEASVHVSQWSPLDFELSKNGYPRGPGLNTDILETNGEAVFDETDYSYYPGYTFEYWLTMDSTQEALPPGWLYTDPYDEVDPFVQSQTILIAPASGELMLQITSDSTSAIDTLYLQSPVKKFLLANPAAYMRDTVDCGAVTAGDTIQFYLHSNEKIVAGMNMYPVITLPGSGGGTPTIAARGGPTSGVSSLNLRSRLLKSLAEKKSHQEKLLAKKKKNSMNMRPLSSSRVASLQQKNVKVQAVQGNTATLAVAQRDTLLATLNFEDETDLGFNNVTANVLLEESDSILLGQTIYYYAKKKGGKLQIIETTNSQLPTGNNVITDPTVWSSTPVTISQSNKPNAGKRPGVYWETQKPIPNGSGNLPSGMIRLIGRYWSQDSVYKVTLSASYQGMKDSIVIEVLKPVKLFEWKNITDVTDKKNFPHKTSDYSSSTDVFGYPLNIDSLIISVAGVSGIPPQMIKAQMFRESILSGYHFDPSYRYEPWQDFVWQGVNRPQNDPFINQPFYITATFPNGDGEMIPTNHSNLYPKGLTPKGYPSEPVPVTISDYALNNWSQFKKINADGTITILGAGSDDLNNLWLEYYKKYTSVWESASSAERATEEVKKEIKKEYDITAQTRKVASYGLIQMLYTTALGRGYNEGLSISKAHAPEHLNENNILMPLYQTFTLLNLKSIFGINISVSDGQWNNGWEAVWGQELKKYNNNSTKYSNSVLKAFPYFEPK